MHLFHSNIQSHTFGLVVHHCGGGTAKERHLGITAASRWEWLDFDADESKQVRDFIRQEIEGEGLDPLRIGAPVRDRIAEILFPGTSTQFRRLRYVILTAAMLGKKGASIGTLRQSQATLNAELVRANPGQTGIIGRRIRERDFVHLHWTAVRKWGLLTHVVDPRDVTVENGLAAFQCRPETDEEGGVMSEQRVSWDPTVVKLVEDFWAAMKKRAGPSILCTRAEVDFILGQWRALPDRPVLAAIASQVGERSQQSRAAYPWQLAMAGYPQAKRDIEYAKAISLICWAAQLAYNLSLLCSARRLQERGVQTTWQASGRGLDDTTAEIEAQYQAWQLAFSEEKEIISPWADENQWDFLQSGVPGTSVPRAFLAGTARKLRDGHLNLETREWTTWVTTREQKANPAPKLSSEQHLATWSGKPEMARRWDFRWKSCVCHFVEDAENPVG